GGRRAVSRRQNRLRANLLGSGVCSGSAWIAQSHWPAGRWGSFGPQVRGSSLALKRTDPQGAVSSNKVGSSQLTVGRNSRPSLAWLTIANSFPAPDNVQRAATVREWPCTQALPLGSGWLEGRGRVGLSTLRRHDRCACHTPS